MKTIFIKDLAAHKGEQITVKGWVYNLRSSGKITFLQLRDGTGFAQAIVEEKSLKQNSPERADEIWAQAQKITLESSVEITGVPVEHPKQPGTFEIHASDVKIIQISLEYPIGKKEHGPDFLLDLRHLWLRSPKQWAILRIRSAIYGYVEQWLKDHLFVRFDSPILTPAACEGTTTLFAVDYFDLGQAFLSQSGQLYLEAGIASVGRCYDFGPVFRAEKSKTRRHLTEFWMMDAEAAFVEHDENLKIQEELISFVVQSVLKNYSRELEILERNIEPLKKIVTPFYRIEHKDAVKKLQALGSKITEDDDLGAEDEALLTNQYDKPVFVEKYPAKIKAFYMKRDPNDDTRAMCADLLAPEGYGEIIGGSQREDDYETLLARIKEQKLPVEAFEWYLDLRRYGSVPHSGFGIGLERLVTWVTGIHHLRETIPFPRMINRKTP